MEFEILLENAVSDLALKREIVALLEKKKSGEELDKGNRIQVIDSFLIEKLNYYDNFLKGYQFKTAPGFEDLNFIFRKSLNEAWL